VAGGTVRARRPGALGRDGVVARGIGIGLRSGPTVRALAQSSADGLWVGGTFTVAGGRPSCSLALWQGTAGRSS
jgi:hypothetical protein